MESVTAGKKIVIAGGGFGGVRTALDLSRLLPRADITLINDTPFHSFHPDLYEVATAILDKEQKIDFKNLAGTINIPLNKIFFGKNVKVVVDQIKEGNLEENNLSCRELGKVDYDFLILGLGSTTNYFAIEGAEEFSHPLKRGEDALNIRNDLDELVERSNQPLSVVIAGGGFTGIELAGELINFLNKLEKKHGRRGFVTLTILEGSPSVLSGMPLWASKKALQRLQSLGVKVLLGHLIKKVDEEKVYCGGGQAVAYDYLIWTSGIKGGNIDNKIKGMEVTKQGQIAISPTLNLDKYPHVFVVGDLAAVLDKKRDCPVPATAWAAIGQAKVAALNIKLMLLGKKLLDYQPQNPIFVVPVGGKFALSNAYNLQFKGLTGWILKRLVSVKYMVSILPASEALITWWKGVKIYNNND